MMDIAQHTPGPWTIVDHGKGAQWIENGIGAAVAELPDWLPEVFSPRDANGRLIAAAPDLLASLNELIPLAGTNNDSAWRKKKAFAIALSRARAAVAKAAAPAEAT